MFFFFFNDTATTEIYTLSLHDALPISSLRRRQERVALHLCRHRHAEEGERRRGQVDDSRIGGREAARGEDDARRLHHVGGGMVAAPLLQVRLEEGPRGAAPRRAPPGAGGVPGGELPVV